MLSTMTPRFSTRLPSILCISSEPTAMRCFRTHGPLLALGRPSVSGFRTKVASRPTPGDSKFALGQSSLNAMRPTRTVSGLRLASGGPQTPLPDNDETHAEPRSLSSTIRRYGIIGGLTYVCISASVFWSLYFVMLYSGFDAEYLLQQIRPMFEELGLPLPDPHAEPTLPKWLTDVIDPVAFGATFLLTKPLLPFEIAATVAVTRALARRWIKKR